MRRKVGRFLSAVMGAALIATQLPAYTAQAAWMPDHQIPAYQQKDIFSEETVTIKGLDVEEVVNATASPVVTKSMEKNVKFVIFNSTKQKVEQEVTCTDGKLPDLKLVKNHNYIIEASDSEYYMPNVYVWVKDNKLVDIKKNVDTGEYPEVDTLSLYKREQVVENPAEDQRVRSNIRVYTQQGGLLFNVKFKLTSNVETLEASTGDNGKLTLDLLEDVVYMVTADNPNYTVDPFPLVIKDKSEYGAGKYTYDFSSCAMVEKITMVNKSDAHKNDTVLTNTNYGEIYNGVYTGIEGNTTITGMNFKDFLVLDRKLDKSTVTGIGEKDYDVLDIKIVNPHRWEIAYLAAGDYKITEKLDSNRTVSNVYYLDESQELQPVEFSQNGKEVTFSMSTLSMYPVVIEYEAGTQEVVKTGWQNMDGKWYYLDENGEKQTNWQKVDGKWYYLDKDGVMQTGWQKINGKWYYMNASGAMLTGWQKINGKWYYMNTSGAMLTGWQKIGGKWYYMNTSGAMQTGWQKISGKWYYMNTSGAMLTGWQKIGGKWYYMNASGAMLTGWQKISGKWYYMNTSGAMQTGWLKLGNKWYYLNASGAMVTGSQKIGGKWYRFNASGVWIK